MIYQYTIYRYIIEVIYEDIIHLIHEKGMTYFAPEEPILIAREVLDEASGRAPNESIEDLNLALSELYKISGSPILSAA